MADKVYGGYHYIDRNYLYVYPNTDVLVNKFNEKDANKARELEHRVVATQTLFVILLGD